ncbi:MAG: glycosyltransferase [Candidatus Caenarcaniphilales bacterium]|nr:glycosyltransferase [Candidatus Caenarcaniphilales bacterium]
MDNPLISVVIPSYNQAKYVADNINSILQQTYKNFEIIFIDDGSTDNTEEVLKPFIDKDSRLKYFKQVNSERAVARSYGISKAEGKYVCLVDSDDTWLPNKLETQLNIMENNPNIVLCYAAVNRINPENKPLANASRQQKGASGLVYFHLLKRNFVPSVTPMIRKSALDQVGTQVTDFIPYEDWDFWLRLSRFGEFFHIIEPLGNYRIHPGQSVQNVKAEKIEEVTLKVLDANTNIDNFDAVKEHLPVKVSSDNDLSKILEAEKREAYSLAYLRFAYWYILAEKPEFARSKLIESIQKNFLRILDIRFITLWVCSYVSKSKIFGKTIRSLLGKFH